VKRFWKSVGITEEAGGWAVVLDGKPVKTPMRAPLVVPTQSLAQAIAAEWNSIEKEIDPHAMPLTGLANVAIDRVRPNPAAFAAGLAKYAEADLTCYRAEGPPELVRRQEQNWDPLLSWARRRFDVDFRTTTGIVHVGQPRATVERLSHAVSALDEFRLAGLSPLVTIGGSLVAALAVFEEEILPTGAWNAVTVDDRCQLEQWGADSEAEQRLENNRRDFLAAARFLQLLSD
jgi:chaperone required for assembly of F1-ATPase